MRLVSNDEAVDTAGVFGKHEESSDTKCLLYWRSAGSVTVDTLLRHRRLHDVVVRASVAGAIDPGLLVGCLFA